MGDLALRFLGHAAFDLRWAGVRLCLDPHRPGALNGRFQLPEINGPFDGIIHSHGHEDHSAWTPALGTTRVIDPPCPLGKLALDSRPAFHDTALGLKMGMTRMLDLRCDGLRLVHSGDLGRWDTGDLAWLAGCDVLLLAAGGTWTLGPEAAADLARRCGARVVVPMHCADPRIDLALRPASEFLAAWSGPVLQASQLDESLLASVAQPTALLLDGPI